MPDKPRESPFSWRLATEDDFDVIIHFCRKIEAEWLDNVAPYSEAKVTPIVQELIKNKTIIIYENNGVPLGIVGIHMSELHWWSEAVAISDVLFYIEPEFRSLNAFNRALRMCQDYAKINRVPLHFSFFTDKDTKRKLKLFKRKGYTVQGFTVYKDFSQVTK